MRCREALALAHTKTNIAYAVRLRGEILNAIGRGSLSYANYFPDSPNCKIFMEQTDKPPVSIPTVGELLHDYLNLAKRNLALSTFNCYDANTKLHLLPRWESTPVTEVRVRELRSWIKAFTCKRKTLQLILTPLRNTLEHALDDQLIDANPFDVIRLNKILARTQLKSGFKAAPLISMKSKQYLMRATVLRNAICSNWLFRQECARPNTSP